VRGVSRGESGGGCAENARLGQAEQVERICVAAAEDAVADVDVGGLVGGGEAEVGLGVERVTATAGGEFELGFEDPVGVRELSEAASWPVYMLQV